MTPEQPFDYARYRYQSQRHHERYKRFVTAQPHKLICQECGGAGGEVEPVLDYGQGPWEECGLCEGTGYLTPYLRGLWLGWKAEESRNAKRRKVA